MSSQFDSHMAGQLKLYNIYILHIVTSTKQHGSQPSLDNPINAEMAVYGQLKAQEHVKKPNTQYYNHLEGFWSC